MIAKEMTLMLKMLGDSTSVVASSKSGQTSVRAFNGEVDQTDKSGRKASASMEQMSGTVNTLKRVVGGYLSLRFAHQLLEASAVQEQAVASLDASLASMHRTTAGLSGQLQTLASEVQRDGIIGDEAIIRGQSFLTTYGQITDDMLPRATRLMADLAAKMGGDTVQAANMVGKASMGMVGELAQAGITFSEEAKKGKDFALILAEMEAQVGGVNARLAATDSGRIKQLHNNLGDLQEVAGAALAKALIPTVDYLNNELIPTLSVGAPAAMQFMVDGWHILKVAGGLALAGLITGTVLLQETFAGVLTWMADAGDRTIQTLLAPLDTIAAGLQNAHVDRLVALGDELAGVSAGIKASTAETTGSVRVFGAEFDAAAQQGRAFRDAVLGEVDQSLQIVVGSAEAAARSVAQLGDTAQQTAAGMTVLSSAEEQVAAKTQALIDKLTGASQSKTEQMRADYEAQRAEVLALAATTDETEKRQADRLAALDAGWSKYVDSVVAGTQQIDTAVQKTWEAVDLLLAELDRATDPARIAELERLLQKLTTKQPTPPVATETLSLWKSTADGMQGYMASAFEQIQSKGRVSFRDLGDTLKRSMIGAISQIESQWLMSRMFGAPGEDGSFALAGANPWAMGAVAGGLLLAGGLFGGAEASGPSPYQIAQQEALQAVDSDLARLTASGADWTTQVNEALDAVQQSRMATEQRVDAEDQLRQAVMGRYDAETQRLNDLGAIYRDLGNQAASLRGQIAKDRQSLIGAPDTLQSLEGQLAAIVVNQAPVRPDQTVTEAQAAIAQKQARQAEIYYLLDNPQLLTNPNVPRADAMQEYLALPSQISQAQADLPRLQAAWDAYTLATVADTSLKEQQIKQLSALRDATLSAVQAQVQLEQKMIDTADAIHGTLARIRFEALTPVQQVAQLETQWQTLRDRAQTATGSELAALGDQLNALAPQLLQLEQNVYANGIQALDANQMVLSDLAAVEQRLREQAPANYQEQAANLLAGIDGKLLDMGQIFTDGQNAVAAEIAAMNSAVTTLLRAIKQGLGIPAREGLHYVPYDGFQVTAHAREAVLTADQADAWRANGHRVNAAPVAIPVPAPVEIPRPVPVPVPVSIPSTSTSTITDNAGGGSASLDPTVLARAIAEALQGQMGGASGLTLNLDVVMQLDGREIGRTVRPVIYEDSAAGFPTVHVRGVVS